MTGDPTDLGVGELEDALRAIERERRRYAELFESAPVGYLVTDVAGTISEANRAVGALAATEPETLIGKPLADLVAPEQRAAFRDEFLLVTRECSTRRWTTQFQALHGGRVVVEVTVAPALTAGSGQEGLRWVVQDVSDRVEAEREHRLASEYEERFSEQTAGLEEQRAWLEAVVENIPAGLVIVDRERRVLTANDRAREILGVEAVEKPIATLGWVAYYMDGRRYEPGAFPLERTLATGEVVRNERIELVTPEGSRVVIDVSTAPVLDSAGESVGALSLFQDVTLQERQERAEREFVTNAAHELQSPLAAIVSAVEVLQAGAKDGPQRDVFLDHIEREADRLARLVRALLILARTQIGLEAPRDELVALCPLLEEVGGGLRLSSTVEVDVDCPEELAVLTNRELVEQALVNLTENAAKHTRSGRIVLSARDLPDGNVEIDVTDTGSGIAPAERPKIFERFYRADTNGTIGFGLGLPIVRAVADALGGELELDSTVDVGTTVRLRLPGAASMVSA